MVHFIEIICLILFLRKTQFEANIWKDFLNDHNTYWNSSSTKTFIHDLDNLNPLWWMKHSIEKRKKITKDFYKFQKKFNGDLMEISKQMFQDHNIDSIQFTNMIKSKTSKFKKKKKTKVTIFF